MICAQNILETNYTLKNRPAGFRNKIKKDYYKYDGNTILMLQSTGPWGIETES